MINNRNKLDFYTKNRNEFITEKYKKSLNIKWKFLIEI